MLVGRRQWSADGKRSRPCLLTLKQLYCTVIYCMAKKTVLNKNMTEAKSPFVELGPGILLFKRFLTVQQQQQVASLCRGFQAKVEDVALKHHKEAKVRTFSLGRR